MQKKIKINNGKEVYVAPGDVLFVSLTPDNIDFLVRGRYLDSLDGIISFSILNPNLEVESVSINENRVVKIEKPN